jgi:hypothetical protein
MTYLIAPEAPADVVEQAVAEYLEPHLFVWDWFHPELVPYRGPMNTREDWLP